MRKFSGFLREKAMVASGRDAERHVKQYLNPDVVASTQYKVLTKHGDVEAGEHIKVDDIIHKDGKFHAVTHHGGTRKEIPISKLDKPKIGRAGTNPQEKEEYHLNHLNSIIEKAKQDSKSDEITIHTPDGNMVRVHRAEKAERPKGAKGDPKADFVLKDKSGNPVRFMSHKDGTTAKEFQQFGGVSQEKELSAVKDFSNILNKNHANGLQGTGTVAYSLDKNNKEHHGLIHRAVFGNNFGKEHGVDNVHSVDQGEYRLEPHPNGQPGHFVLRSAHSWQNGKIPESQQFVIHATHKGDRKDLGIPGARVTVGPVEARKIAKTYGPTKQTNESFIIEAAMRQGISHIKDLKHEQVAALLKNDKLDMYATEKSDGMAFEIGHDEHGFYSRTSHSEKMRQPEDYEAAAEKKFGKDFDPTISQHFGRIHRALYNNTTLLNRMKQGQSIKGEIFYRPHGRPAEDGGIRFVGTSYDPKKMGNLGSFIVHSRLPENRQHDLNALKQASDHNFTVDDDVVPGGHLKVDVKDLQKQFKKINPDILKSRKAADKDEREKHQKALDEIKDALHQRINAHLRILGPKWGNETEGHVLHPTDESQPRVKVISDTFKKNKAEFGFKK